MSYDLDNLFDEVVFQEEDDCEYLMLMQEYIAKFGHSIPMEMIPDRISREEIINKVRISIESGCDNLLELLGIKVKDGCMY